MDGQTEAWNDNQQYLLAPKMENGKNCRTDYIIDIVIIHSI